MKNNLQINYADMWSTYSKHTDKNVLTFLPERQNAVFETPSLPGLLLPAQILEKLWPIFNALFYNNE